MSRATVPSSMDRWKSKNEQQPVSSTARAAARAATSRSGRRSSRVLVADSGTRPRRRLRRAHRTPCDALAARLSEACTPSGPSCRRPSGWPSLRSRFDGKPGPRYGMQLHHAYGTKRPAGDKPLWSMHPPHEGHGARETRDVLWTYHSAELFQLLVLQRAGRRVVTATRPAAHGRTSTV